MPEPVASGVVSPAGAEVAWREDGAGEPVVLAHGVGAALDSWDGVVERLAGEFRLLRYDLRGHGASGKPPGPYALSDFVDDLAGLLDARGIARADVAGFSFGGMIAQAFAIEHPDRARRLVLISSVAGRTVEERERVRARATQLETGGASRTVGAAIERWFTPAFRERHPDIVARRAEQARSNDPAGYAAAYRVFAESDIDEALAGIAAPTLVMTGEHDVGSTPRMARLIHDRVAGSRLEILPGLRHSVLIEAPDLVSRHLGAFLRER